MTRKHARSAATIAAAVMLMGVGCSGRPHQAVPARDGWRVADVDAPRSNALNALIDLLD